MTLDITTTNTRAAITRLLLPKSPTKDARTRVDRFARWAASEGHDPLSPDLAGYRDHLLTDGLAASSVSGYLSTIRARYRSLLKSNDLRDHLGERAAIELQARGASTETANVLMMVNEAVTRLENGIDPELSEVKTEKKQDKVDSEHGTRLTREQASALIRSPGLDTLLGLRDTAILSLMLCTGLREREVVNLEVKDLRETVNGELCCHVRHGKGDKTRAVFYGAGVWCLAVVDKWLDAAHITGGPVFRGLFKGGALRSGKLSTRSIQKIVGRYPVMVDGKVTRVRPHDCRRTYARRCYDEHMDLVAIQQNLGHSSLTTTLHYVGALDAEKRRPPSLYSFNLADLDKITIQKEKEAVK